MSFILLTVALCLLTYWLNGDVSIFCAPYANNIRILLLLFGVLFFVYQEKIVGFASAFAYAGAILFIFIMLYYFGTGTVSYDHFIGIVIAVGMAMGLRHVVWSKRQAQIITYLARISYPLYVCHHFFLNKLEYGFIPVSFLFAHLVSKYIEYPSIAWGKKVMKKYKNNAGLSVER